MRLMQIGPAQEFGSEITEYYMLRPDREQRSLLTDIAEAAKEAESLEALRDIVTREIALVGPSPSALEAQLPALAAMADAWRGDGGGGLEQQLADRGREDAVPSKVLQGLFDLYAHDGVLANNPDRRRAAGLFIRLAGLAQRHEDGRLRRAAARLGGGDDAPLAPAIEDFMRRAMPDTGLVLPPASRPLTAMTLIDEGEEPAPVDEEARKLEEAAIAAQSLAARELRRMLADGHAPAHEIGADERRGLSGGTGAVLDELRKAAPEGPFSIERALGMLRERLSGARGAEPGRLVLLTDRALIDNDLFRGFLDPCMPLDPMCFCRLRKWMFDRHKGQSAVHVLGIGDAFRIDVAHARYERGELVHTEPVLGGTTKSVSFTQTEETETIEITETVSEENKTTEAVAEERFRLETETESIAEQERSAEFGIKGSVKYGVAEIEASVGGATAMAQTERIRQARENARSLTSRAVTEIRRKTTRRTSVRQLARTERVSGFELNNAGNPSFTGYYHAIDAVKTCQLKRIGTRLILRASFQQPMVFLLHCLASGGVTAKKLYKPVPPNEHKTPLLAGADGQPRALATPADITPENFEALAALLGVTGVAQPPDPVSVSHNLHGLGSETSETKWPLGSGSINVPDGYRAVSADVNVMISSSGSEPPLAYIDLTIGQAPRMRFVSGGQNSAPLPSAAGNVVWAYRGHSRNEFTVDITLNCLPTDSAMARWRAQVFDAIWQSHHSRQAAYEAAIRAAEVEAGVRVSGGNPRQNLRMIREELMKLFLGAFCPELYYLGFSSIRWGEHCGGEDDGLSHPPVPVHDFLQAKADGVLLGFLMRAFEFSAMSWRFDPYFTAERGQWCSLLNQRNPDPVFETALRAGHVEIDVPVREGFDQAVLHFIELHEPWEGGDIPELGSQLNKNIALELALAEQLLGTDAGDPWERVVPTSLLLVDDAAPPDL